MKNWQTVGKRPPHQTTKKTMGKQQPGHQQLHRGKQHPKTKTRRQWTLEHICCIMGQQTQCVMKQTKMYVCTLEEFISSRCSHIAVHG